MKIRERDYPLEKIGAAEIICRLINLLQMLRFKAHEYVELVDVLGLWLERFGSLPQHQPIEPDRKDDLLRFLKQATEDCEKIELPLSARQIDRIRSRLEEAGLSNGTVFESLQSFGERLNDELEDLLFLYIPRERVHWYEKPTEGWEEITSRFPNVVLNIEESSKCFACDRYGAAIFHILLVAEFGVIQVAELFGVAGDKPGWSSLERLERILGKNYKDRCALEQKHFNLLEGLMPLMLSIKNSWRHKSAM